ncbi:hypothetical protein VCUG_00352, partial [Vavraia culicis subsp. floridensis]
MDKILIIFGASGNLCRTKILPSILKERLYEGCEIILYSRNIDCDFLQALAKENDEKNIKVVQGEYTDVEKITKMVDNKKLALFYLCIPSHRHHSIVQCLNGLDREVVVALEKPFFTCLKEVEDAQHFKNVKFRFIDHYLLKPLILAFPRFEHRVKPLLENVTGVELFSLESTLAGDRVAFDKDGIFKDMVFTHLFSVYEHIFGNGSLKDLTFKDLHLKGQYNDYEFKGSHTETFSFSVFEHKNGYNVLFIAGKGLKNKETTVKVLSTDNNVTFDIYPGKNVVSQDSVLVDTTMVEKYVKDTYVHDDYDLVLCSLVAGKEFNTVPVDRIKEMYRLLEEVNTARTSLFFYEKGTELPEQVYSFL